MQRGRPDLSVRSVADVGEAGLLEIVKERFGNGSDHGEVWAGDDAAVLATGERSLLTTDVLVEGIDFDLAYGSGRDVGWKSLAVNISDIAAMGGRPTRAVVTLALPPTTVLGVVDSFLDGLVEGAARWDVGIVGGDISGAAQMSVSVAMLGTVDGDPVLRAGARPGDAICVTGSLGGAAGGLFALQGGVTGSSPRIDELVGRQLRPEPRVVEGAQLKRLGATSMIDVSDGLGLDLTRLMTASGTGCAIETAMLPVDPNLGALEGGPDGVELALGGGEDLELLCTIDASRLDEAMEALAPPLAGFTRIGDVTEDGLMLDGVAMKGEELGWDHLRSR